ncbi:MAG: phosphatase PAP2 family protein [Thermomicrobiales bacterium]
MERRRASTTTVPIRTVWIWELGIVGGLAAAFLTLLIVVTRSAPTSFDRRLAEEIQAIPWGILAFIPRLGSELGGGLYGFYLIPALTAAAFALLRHWRPLALLLAVYLLHFVAISPKLFIDAHRPSPDFGVEGAGGLQSFPSGHVQWAVSFYGLLAYLAWRAAPARWRPAVLPIYCAIVLGTMLGRIELGKHWPVDTLAGVLAGLIALRLVIAFEALGVRR